MITGVNAGAWQQQVWGAGGPPLQGTVLRGMGRVEARCRRQSCEADTERMTLRPVPSGVACLRIRKASRLVPSVGPESDAGQKGGWPGPAHQRAWEHRISSWRTGGVRVAVRKQVTSTWGVPAVSHTPHNRFVLPVGQRLTGQAAREALGAIPKDAKEFHEVLRLPGVHPQL